MSKADWIWMPHPGHFIGARSCGFHLNTYVGGHIVSTVGEYLPEGGVVFGTGSFQEIGYQRIYETMVFAAGETSDDVQCCPYESIGGPELDFNPYNTPGDAYAGHLAMCEKWDGRQ